MSTTPDVIEFFPRLERQSRFKREAFDTVEPSKQQWLVKGLWPSTGVCFIAGPWGSGKSFWVLDAMAKVVKGEPVLGRKSKAAGVVYIASEGAAGVRGRIKGLRAEIGKLGPAFDMIGHAPNLTDADDVEELRDELKAAKADMARNGIRLGAVVIDTLSASIPGADENTASGMSPVLAALQSIAADLEILVLMVAHVGKDSERGLRGWSGLMANADGLILFDAADDLAGSGRVEKVKDGQSGDRFGFEREVVEIGTDEDGDPVTTCLVRDSDPPGQKGVSRKLQPKLDLVMRCFHMCMEAGQTENVPAVGGVPPGTKGVPRDQLRAMLQAEGYTAGTQNPDNIRKAMNRHIDQLLELKRLRGNERMVWELK
jgi:hypothetical protein